MAKNSARPTVSCMKQPVSFDSAAGRLTRRQSQVLGLLELGYTNPGIAAVLGISLDGAKWHVGEVMGRLGMESRSEVALRARAKAAYGCVSLTLGGLEKARRAVSG